MFLRGIARRSSPSVFAIGVAALALFAYSSGPPGAWLLLVVGWPAAIGGLVLYFEYGWRRAVMAALATCVLVLALGAVDKTLGHPGNSGGGMPPPASAR
jgi:hypothetical protein